MLGWESSNLFVLDISNENDFKLLKSKICIPVIDGCQAAKRYWYTCYDSLVTMAGGLRSEMVVVGWTKKLFETQEFKELALPPLYLLQLISHWIMQEDIHFIHSCPASSGNVHRVIPLRHILASTQIVSDFVK